MMVPNPIKMDDLGGQNTPIFGLTPVGVAILMVNDGFIGSLQVPASVFSSVLRLCFHAHVLVIE